MFPLLQIIPRIILISFLLFLSPVHADILNGLIGWWTFDEGAGIIAADKSGQGNPGTLTGANGLPTWTTGKFGGALKFNGVDDFVNHKDASDLAGPFSISVWFKPEALGTLQMLVSKYDEDNVVANASYYFGIQTTKKLRAVMIPDAPSLLKVTNGQTTLVDGTWVHAVLTWDGNSANPLKIYLNGKDDSEENPERNDDVSLRNISVNMLIGARTKGKGAAAFFTGLMDDVRIYDRALSSDEVLKLYNQGNFPLTP